MRIYRVEHPEDGRGPFWGEWSNEDHLDHGHFQEFEDAWMSEDEPVPLYEPRRDGITGTFLAKPNVRIGTRSSRMLKTWFARGNIVDILEMAGFVVSVYDVPEDAIQIGHRQVAFEIDRAKLVKRTDVEEWFSLTD